MRTQRLKRMTVDNEHSKRKRKKLRPRKVRKNEKRERNKKVNY